MSDDGIEFFVALETQVWDALVRGDAVADEALLTRDFLGVYTTGFATRAEHTAQLRDGPTMAAYSIADARVITVSETASLLCYRADCRAIRGGVPCDEETMYVSSLWCDVGGRWLNVFSQDTPAVT